MFADTYSSKDRRAPLGMGGILRTTMFADTYRAVTGREHGPNRRLNAIFRLSSFRYHHVEIQCPMQLLMTFALPYSIPQLNGACY
jgi:hypothetical protein